jgi:hypothetical protein
MKKGVERTVSPLRRTDDLQDDDFVNLKRREAEASPHLVVGGPPIPWRIPTDTIAADSGARDEVFVISSSHFSDSYHLRLLISVRVLVNYTLRKETWFVHAIATDARTPISPVLPVPDQVTLIRLLRYLGAGDFEIDEVDKNIGLGSRGSTWIIWRPDGETFSASGCRGATRLAWSDYRDASGSHRPREVMLPFCPSDVNPVLGIDYGERETKPLQRLTACLSIFGIEAVRASY